MVATFRLETTGALAIETKLAALVHAFGDLEPLMQDFGTYLESATIDRFDTESAPDGTAWEQSARAKEDGGKTLTLSGLLRQSITSQASADSVMVGSNRVYAGVHQFGIDKTVSVKGHGRTISTAFGLQLTQPVSFEVNAFERLMQLPARPYLGLSRDDEAELLALAEKHAADAMGGAA